MMSAINFLNDMDGKALIAAWLDDLGNSPPARASPGYMRSVLAYRIQQKTGPKLSVAIQRQLAKLAGSFDMDPKHQLKPTANMKEGMKLLREWNGAAHEVTVLENGFEYRGQRHRSLSAIAREITGTRWSGPAFFGLKGNADAA